MFRLVVLLATLVALASSASVINSRVVGGSLTDISKRPYIVSVRYKTCQGCPFNLRCGGSIISSRIVLTAAQCVIHISVNSLTVGAGTNERYGYGAVVPVKKYIVHEQYSQTINNENDIAIVVLITDLPLNGYTIKPITLVDKQPAHGTISTIVGWGSTIEGDVESKVLREVDVPIVSNDICEINYGSKGRITDSMLCAGSISGGVDGCDGDAGGPLIVGNQLAGIVSWGEGCARPGKPGVYSNIANLRSWIEGTISANS